MIRIRPPDPENDEGFTLIELLVVMIIIGILASIAVPVFLKQRQSGYDAAAKSDLHEAAQAEEQLLVDTGAYGTTAAIASDNNALRPSKNDTVTVVVYSGVAGYCISSKNANSPRTWYYDSVAGGLQPPTATGCPVTTTGPAGGSVTG